MPLNARKNQVQLIKDSLKDLENWTLLQQASVKSFAVAKDELKKQPQDAATIKKFEKAGEKLLNIMEARNQREAALITARKFFRIYD